MTLMTIKVKVLTVPGSEGTCNGMADVSPRNRVQFASTMLLERIVGLYMSSRRFFVATVFVVAGSFLCAQTAYCLTQAYRVKRVIAGEKIELTDGRTIRLAGISIPPPYESVTKERIEKLTSDSRVIIEPVFQKNNVEFSFLYLWGNRTVGPVSGGSPAEGKGFHDVRVGFWDIQKGIGICLNAYLIREGLALVDESQEFEYKRMYMELQATAKNEQKGLWAGLPPKN